MILVNIPSPFIFPTIEPHAFTWCNTPHRQVRQLSPKIQLPNERNFDWSDGNSPTFEHSIFPDVRERCAQWSDVFPKKNNKMSSSKLNPTLKSLQATTLLKMSISHQTLKFHFFLVPSQKSSGLSCWGYIR
jgi:hypothetical protein